MSVQFVRVNMSGGERDLTEIDWLPRLSVASTSTLNRRIEVSDLAPASTSSASSASSSQQADSSSTTKPSFSYGTLITMAINSSTGRQMTLSEIYRWVSNHFEYYRHCQSRSWKNSIRHNLSLSKQFIKIPRAEDDPGKGCYWTIDDNYSLANRLNNKTVVTNPTINPDVSSSSSSSKKRSKRQTLAVPPYVPENHHHHSTSSDTWDNTHSVIRYQAAGQHLEPFISPEMCNNFHQHHPLEPYGSPAPLDFSQYSSIGIMSSTDMTGSSGDPYFNANYQPHEDGLLLRNIMESAGIPLDDEQLQLKHQQHQQQLLQSLMPPPMTSGNIINTYNNHRQPNEEDLLLPNVPSDEFDWDLLIN